MMLEVLWLGGTGFGNGGDGVSQDFAIALDKHSSVRSFRYVPYPADYGQHYSYAESLVIGREALVEAIRDSSYPVIIGGYSQGAAAAGDVAADYAHGLLLDLDIRAAVLIADPLRPEGATAGGTVIGRPRGYGIAGTRRIDGTLPVYWVANEGDPITALPRGNPLRSIADLTEFMAATADPARAEALMLKIITKVSQARLQQWWSWENWRTWGGALAYAKGYLFDGRHTEDYVRLGLCETAAQAVMAHNFGE